MCLLLSTCFICGLAVLDLVMWVDKLLVLIVNGLLLWLSRLPVTSEDSLSAIDSLSAAKSVELRTHVAL